MSPTESDGCLPTLDALTRWLDDRLGELSARRTGPVDGSRVRPWARVVQAPTTLGSVWVKAPGPETRFEVALYAVLVRHVPDAVLSPLAVDVERGLLLLPDGGPSLAADADLRPALRTYARVQRRLADHLPELLAAGVPDLRPHVMSQRFDEALDAAGDGIDPRVPALRGRFADWCAELAAAPGRPSIDHNDLHAHNVLADQRFYDWGDSGIAHPFASLLVPLEVTPPDVREELRNTYLAEFADLAPHPELVRTAELACRVAIAGRALTWLRALMGSPDEGRYAGAARRQLERLIEG